MVTGPRPPVRPSRGRPDLKGPRAAADHHRVTPSQEEGNGAPDAVRERARLNAISALRLLDGPVLGGVAEAIRLAAEVCGVEKAVVNIIDSEWQTGLTGGDEEPLRVPREAAMCNLVVSSGRAIITPDASEEAIFAGNPFVTGELGAVKFYASVPLRAEGGEVVGTLCAYDERARDLSPGQERLLASLGQQIIGMYELRDAAARAADAAQRLADQAEHTAEVLATSSEAYIAIGVDGLVTGWNPAAEWIFGWAADEAIGQELAALLIPEQFRDDHRAGVARAAARRTASGAPVVATFSRRSPALRSDGRSIVIDLAVWPSRSGNGWHAFARDVSHLAAEQQARDLAERRWALAFDAAPIGMCLIDPGPDAPREVVAANRTLCETLGRDLEEINALGLAGLTHPDDRSRDREAVEEVLSGRGDMLRAERRYLAADGRVIWGRVSLAAARAPDGERFVILQLEDVSATRVAERGRQDAERQLGIAFQHAPNGIAIVGVTEHDLGRLIRVNPAMTRIIQRADLVGLRLDELLESPDAAGLRTRMNRLATGSSESFEMVCRFRAGGGFIYGRTSLALVRDADGHPDHAIAHVHDVTRQQAHEEWLTRHATTDSLTGLPNRLSMRERLVAEIEGLREGHGALAVVMLDLDGFKSVNDTLGQDCGDEVLVAAAAAMAAAVPPDAMVARLGGDEFVVITPHHDERTAAALVERVERSVAERISDRLGGRLAVPVTVSAGLIMTCNPATAPEDLIRQADESMYVTKRARSLRRSPA